MSYLLITDFRAPRLIFKTKLGARVVDCSWKTIWPFHNICDYTAAATSRRCHLCARTARSRRGPKSYGPTIVEWVPY